MARQKSCMAGCAGGMAKCLLILFNVLFLISGIAILGMGIWLRVDPKVVELQNLVNLDNENPNLAIAAYILIGFGGIVLLVAVFGFCGGIHESRCLLGLFIGCLSVIFVGEIVAGVLGAVYKSDVEDTIEYRLQTILKNDYRVGRTKYTQPWDFVQVWLACCGVDGYKDYINNNVTFPGNQSVPFSCCTLINDNADDPQPENNTACQAAAKSDNSGPYLHAIGCVDSVTNKIKEYDVTLIAVTISIAFVQVFGVVLACCVCKNIRSSDV